MGFTLHFHFGANDFFTNEILTKTYELKCEPQEDDPFSFEVCSQVNSIVILQSHTYHGKQSRQQICKDD